MTEKVTDIFQYKLNKGKISEREFILNEYNRVMNRQSKVRSGDNAKSSCEKSCRATIEGENEIFIDGLSANNKIFGAADGRALRIIKMVRLCLSKE